MQGGARALSAVFLFSFALASNSLAAPDASTFRFTNGASLTYEQVKGGTQVTLKTSDGKSVVVGQGELTVFPDASVPRAMEIFYRLTPDAREALVTINHQVYQVTNTGQVTHLPLHPKCIDRQGDIFWENIEIQYKGRSYSLYSFEEANADDHKGVQVEGETYLIRDDGVWVRLDYASHRLSKKSFQVTNGILKVSGSPRAIDLERFEMEARFMPGIPKRVENAEGEPIEDPVAFTKQTFTDMGQELDSKPGAVFEADPEREPFIEELRMRLASPENGSAMLLGDAGVGKTQLLRRFVYGIKRGEFPEIPRTWTVLEIDGMSLSQGTKYVGSFESRLGALVEACKMVPMFLAIDEIHTLRGAGTHESNKNDFFAYLRTGLADGTIKIIGSSNEDVFYPAFAGDSALLRRFGMPLTLKEPSPAKLPKYLEGWVQKFGKPKADVEVLKAVVQLSEELNAVGSQPAKSTDLLSKTYALMEIRGERSHGPTLADVHAAAQKLYQVDPSKFDPALMRKKLSALPDEMNRDIVGMDWPKRALAQLAREKFARASDLNRPAIRMMMPGPKGTGKSALAQSFARALGEPFHRIDMTKYPDYRYVDEFRRELAAAVRKSPGAVILIDEIEKSDLAVQNALLLPLDSGILTVSEHVGSSSSGGTTVTRVSLRNASILFASNAAQEMIQKRWAGGGAVKTLGFGSGASAAAGPADLTSDELRAQMAMEGISLTLLDRIPVIAAALPANKNQFRDILKLHVELALKEQSLRRGADVVVGNIDVFLDFAVGKFFKPGMSNRLATDLASTLVRSGVADAVFKGTAKPGKKLKLLFDEKGFEEALLTRGACQQALGG